MTLSIDEIISRARQARSLMHREELEWLCHLAHLAPDGVGVEVGVYCGASLIAWSLVREGRGSVIGVDDWSYQNPEVDKFLGENNKKNSLQVDGLKAVCERNLATASVAALLIDSNSVKAARQAPNDLAFVFIDGDHTSPAIDNDIAAWTPKIRSGGVMAFHDYGRRKNNCNVGGAVDAWQKREPWKRIGLVDTTIGFWKP